MVDKELAVKLRKQGMTYKSIAAALACSEAWCKKNLVDVEPEGRLPEVQMEAKLSAIAILEEALLKLRWI